MFYVSEKAWEWMGIFELVHTDYKTRKNNQIEQYNYPVILIKNEDGLARIYADAVHLFQINQTIPYRNLLRKWSKLCLSYDFQKNEAQAAFNGRVSNIVKNPVSFNYMLNTFDARNIGDAAPNTQFLLIIGRYYYDENPFIGRMANVNVWSRTMNAQELEDRTRNVS